MTRANAIKQLKRLLSTLQYADDVNAVKVAIKALENIVALGEDMRICRESITDEKVLIGFNMAVAICNKYLGKGEEV